MYSDFFVFPLKYTDILEETADQRYRVMTHNSIAKTDQRIIKRTITEIERALFDNFTEIKDSERFDFLFHWIRFLEDKCEEQPIEFLESTGDLLTNALKKILDTIKKEIPENVHQVNQDEQATIDELRNCFKMIIFLLFFYMENTCIKKGKNSIQDELYEAQNQMNNQQQQGSKQQPLKKKKKGGKDQMKNEHIERLVDKQIEGLKLIKATFDVKNLKGLWNKRPIDDEFFKYYVQVALKMLESQVLIKQTNAKNLIFQIMECVLVEFPDAFKDVQLKLINIIYDDQNIVEPIADFIQKAYRCDKHNMVKLATDTLTMLVSYIMERTNLNNESQAIKNAKEFLCILSQSLPKLFYNNLSTFMQLYDSEAYLLRNAINEILGQIIRQVLTQNQLAGEDQQDIKNQEMYQNMKNKLLDKLIQRVYDKNAFARTYVLGILSQLCEDNVIPLDYLKPILQVACDRIKDVSALVRRKAIQLLWYTIKFYYFVFVESQHKRKFLSFEELQKDNTLNTAEIEEIKQQLDKVDKQIRELQPTSGEGEQEEYHQRFDILNDELKTLRRKLDHCIQIKERFREYEQFLKSIQNILPNLNQLLGSKNQGDVIETIKLFNLLYKYNIQNSELGIRKMLVLIWSKEKNIIEELLKTYWYLFLNNEEFPPQQITWNLIKLVSKSTLTESTSLEEMIYYILNWNKNIDPKDLDKKKDMFNFRSDIYSNLWEIFTQTFQSLDESQKIHMRSALQLLRFFASKNPDIMTTKMESLKSMLSSFAKQSPDWFVVKEIALIIEKVQKPQIQQQINSQIQILTMILLKNLSSMQNEWFPAAEAILNTIFSNKKTPDQLMQYLIIKSSEFLFSTKTKKNLQSQSQQIQYPTSPINNDKDQLILEQQLQENQQNLQLDSSSLFFEEKLSKLIFIVGHVALKFLLKVDETELNLKKMKNEAETQYTAKQKEGNSEDLDKIHGGIEAEFDKRIEQLHQIPENNILYNNLLSLYEPIVSKICKDILNGKRSMNDNVLNRVAVLSLCKFMCVSSKYCKENLNIIFGLLDSHFDSVIKTNILISLGDLIHRHPNIIEPFSQQLYKNLHDKDVNVRKTTLMVITHLVLNDMLKLKGEISDVALLFNDPDPKIQNLVKLFFHELHKKDNKIIYNLLPEAIGRLSSTDILDENNNENNFAIFAKNIMAYLEKDKYSETLVDKLCTRFKNTKNVKEWRNTAYCLSLLAYNEKGLRKLLEMFECYREKLNDPQIMESFRQILMKLKKFTKQEMKAMVEEWESKLNNFMTETAEEKQKKPQKVPRKIAQKKEQQQGQTNGVIDLENESQQQTNVNANRRNLQIKQQQKKKKGQINYRGGKKNKEYDSSSEDENEDDFIDDDIDEENENFDQVSEEDGLKDYLPSQKQNTKTNGNNNRKQKQQQTTNNRNNRNKNQMELEEEDEEVEEVVQQPISLARSRRNVQRKKMMDIESEEDDENEEEDQVLNKRGKKGGKGAVIVDEDFEEEYM